MRDHKIKRVKKAYAASLACMLASLAGLAVGGAVEAQILGESGEAAFAPTWSCPAALIAGIALYAVCMASLVCWRVCARLLRRI
jgi:hypothetical protein